MVLTDSWGAAASAIREQQADIYSFDIFDTLLLRKYHPDLVLHRVASWLDAQAGRAPGASLQSFHALYKEHATQQERAGRDREVCGDAFFDAWGGEHAEALLDYYIEQEFAALKVNTTYQGLLQELSAQGKRVLIISDMYLPASALARLLERFGYGSLYSALFVSSDVALLKRTGKLFDHIRVQLSIAPTARWVHTGDNPTADGHQAAANEITPVIFPHVSWAGDPLQPRISAGERTYRALHQYSDNFWQSYGFYRLGPIFAAYIHGVLEYAQQHSLSRLVFPAREGLFLKELYLSFLQTTQQKGPPASYAYLSRAATLQFGGGADEYAFSCLHQNGARTIRELLKPWLDGESAARVATELGIGLDARLSATAAWEICSRLATHELVLQRGAQMHEDAKAIVGDYLTTIGLRPGARVGFVDVGWGAQIQFNLHRGMHAIYGGQTGDLPEVHGLYMGLNGHALYRQHPSNVVTGLLTQGWDAPWGDTALMEFPAIVELACRAPHGTVLRLQRDATGKPAPLLKSDAAPSRQLELQDSLAIAHIQAGIAAYVTGYAELWAQAPFAFTESREFALRMAERVVRYPSTAEVTELGRLANIADLGSDREAQLTDIWWHARHTKGGVFLQRAKLLAFAFRSNQCPRGLPLHVTAPVRRTEPDTHSAPGEEPTPCEKAWQTLAEAQRSQPVRGTVQLAAVPPGELQVIRATARLGAFAVGLRQALRRLKRALRPQK